MTEKAPVPGNNLSELEKTNLELKKALAEIERLKRENTELEAEVRRLSIDAKTGLLGNDVLEPRLNFLIQELNHQDKNRPSTLKAVMIIALDMNGLKLFNDRFSHAVGDQALMALANRLRQIVKMGDLVFRPKGGDEFTMILPIKPFQQDSNEVDFDKIFQRIQKAVNTDLSIEVDNETFPITASMGYSVLSKGENKTPKELLGEADEKERANKKNIKNNNGNN